ncbi:MAG: hypothetical protein GXO24_07135 [Chlorobi bacterium]|nr:hypothetical protein [Chlorobiota bacterium]
MAETTQHFVELKGKKIEEAIPQLSRCIELLGLENFRKMAYIVTSRSPLRSTGIQKMKRNFKKATGADLKIKNGFIIQNI